MRKSLLVNVRLLATVVTMLCACILVQAQELYKPNAKGTERSFNVQLPMSSKPQLVKTEIIDGLVILEGDIILGPLVSFEGDGGVAISGHSYRWPNSTIPYVIENGHPKKASIEWAIRHVQATTNLCLVPRTTQRDYVRFINGGGCASYVGKRGGRQNIVIGNCSRGSVAHEILHASGLWHEHSREDRDRYIRVNSANITSGKAHNFTRHVSDGIDIGTYDYGSIMHYGSRAFSKNGKNTIDVKIPPGRKTTVIGQRNGLSSKDKAAINTLYKSSPCKEDCLSFNPSRVGVKKKGNLWIVVDGNHAMFSAPNKIEADKIVRIIKHYKLNRSCFVGRPKASFQYMLRGKNAPSGAFRGEDCIPFNPSRLVIRREGRSYLMTDGRSRMFMFPNREEAEQTLAAIKKYGFTRTCYVGRPKASLQYMRK